MNFNNNNKAEMDDDLSFIPLNLQEPFSSKNSPWFPLINLEENIQDNMRSNDIAGFTPPKSGMGINSNLIDIPPIPILSNSQMPLINTTPNINDINYPSEVDSEKLHCYGTPSHCSAIDLRNNTYEDPMHMDILKSYDFSLDDTCDTRGGNDNEIERIFKLIKTNHSSIYGTLRAYKIPAPIAYLIMKQIIKLTLKYSDN